MQNRAPSKFSKISLLLALVLHVLFLLSFITVIVLPADEEKKPPQMYSLPSYIYNGAIQPTMAQTEPSNASTSSPTITHETTPTDTQTANATHANQAVYQQHALKRVSAAQFWGVHESVMSNSTAALRQNQMNRVLNKSDDPEPILLVGEKNADANPLVILMARALSKYFSYPKNEGSFGIHGRVLVQLTLNPDGEFSDPEVVQSSNNENFDTAALYAVNKAPRVVDAHRYLSKAKSYVVGFIFD